MKDPIHEVRWTTAGKYGAIREHVKHFGATEGPQALAFAKSKPAEYEARVMKVSEIWSATDEKDSDPSPIDCPNRCTSGCIWGGCASTGKTSVG